MDNQINKTLGLNMKDQLYVLKAMFYLLSPSETYYEKAENVPNLTQDALVLMFGFIFIEQIIFLLKNGKFNGRLADGITSISAGIVSTIPNIFFREMNILAYNWIYENLKIMDLSWDSIWTYIITFLFVDMMYYWFHRAAHEVNLFWAAHQTHHSSEDYNFTTSLRQSMFQKYTSWYFYLPLAFFVRPSIFIVHSHMNLIYQFWLHTEIVDQIGPLEYVLNTPSHHRVHHGRNPYCIDKNYAGVLIIWDRLFGTFEAEKKTEKLAYGLVHPIESFDPTYVQIFNYQYLWKRFNEAKSLNEKFNVLFKGPGWVPGSPRLGFPEDLPPVVFPFEKKGIKLSNIVNMYTGAHFLVIVVFFAEFLKEVKLYPSLIMTSFVVLIVYSLTCFGSFFDGKSYAVYLEFFRCIIFMLLLHFLPQKMTQILFSSDVFMTLFYYFNVVSLVVMLILSLLTLFKSPTQPTANGHASQNGHAKPVKSE